MYKTFLATTAIAFAISPGFTFADFAFTANEKTQSISVIDTHTDKIVDTICLGSDPAQPGTPQPSGPCDGENPLAAFYNGQVGTHGLWLTPDEKILLAANRISGTVAAIDTETNELLGYAPVGREPHLAVVSPDGKEAWVAMRGENYISVLEIDSKKLHDASIIRTKRMKELAVLPTVQGPSMVSFTSDGKHAFVVAGKEKRIEKFDVKTRKPIASQSVVAPFTPFGLVTPDDKEIYLVHKGAGKLSILRTSDLGVIVEGLEIGPRANHVAFIDNFAYISIGGPKPNNDNPNPEGKVVIIDRETHKIVNEMTGSDFTGNPHGIWATSDRKKIYLGHENGDRVTVIDPKVINNPNDDAVIASLTNPDMKSIVDIVIKN